MRGQAGGGAGATVPWGGTDVWVEGAQCSDRWVCVGYRSWGVEVSGRTKLQEAKLARETRICYATMALATDYDCWYEGEEDVTITQVIETVNKNVAMAKKIVATVIPRIGEERTCACASAMEYGVMTAPEAIPPATKEKLKDIIGKYVS